MTMWPDRKTRRRFIRRKTANAAVLYAGADTLPCMVTDISTHGARLALGQGGPAPGGRVTLFMSAAEPMQDCSVVWRNADEFGVRFV